MTIHTNLGFSHYINSRPSCKHEKPFQMNAVALRHLEDLYNAGKR